MRLIDADELWDEIRNDVQPLNISMISRHIHNAPTIEPESLIPHGRWEEYIEFSDGQIGSYCSECHHGATYFPQRPDRYCRGCGARMDKA